MEIAEIKTIVEVLILSLFSLIVLYILFIVLPILWRSYGNLQETTDTTRVRVANSCTPTGEAGSESEGRRSDYTKQPRD